MFNKEKLNNNLIESAALEIEFLDSSDDEIDEILENLEEDLMAVSAFRYTHKSVVPKCHLWFTETLPKLDDNRFKMLIRVERELFNMILDLIKDHEVFNGKNSKLQFTVFFQLALVLYRLGSSGENASVGKIASLFGVGDGGTISKITKRVFKSILSLEKTFLYWPTKEERKSIVSETIDELPHCVGYLDGSEIPLNEAPVLDPTSYFSRTRKYSIKLQAICDYKLRIRHILVGYPGSVHDAKIFRNSGFGRNTKKFLSEGEWVAADSAYKLTEHIITPFRKNSTITTAEKRKKFNRYFSTYRVRIENCFGIMKQKFGSLKELKIGISDKKHNTFACTWVRVCCILYNIIIPHIDIEDFNFPLEVNNCDNYAEDSSERMGEIKRQAIYETIFKDKY